VNSVFITAAVRTGNRKGGGARRSFSCCCSTAEPAPHRWQGRTHMRKYGTNQCTEKVLISLRGV
jgi:hypothetical protein